MIGDVDDFLVEARCPHCGRPVVMATNEHPEGLPSVFHCYHESCGALSLRLGDELFSTDDDRAELLELRDQLLVHEAGGRLRAARYFQSHRN